MDETKTKPTGVKKIKRKVKASGGAAEGAVSEPAVESQAEQAAPDAPQKTSKKSTKRSAGKASKAASAGTAKKSSQGTGGVLAAALAALVLGLVCIGLIVMQKKSVSDLVQRVDELEGDLKEKQETIDSLQTRVDEAGRDTLQAYLPDTFYVAYGRTLEIYNDQVAFGGDLDEYSFNWVCDIGKCLSRKYMVEGDSEQAGGHELTLTIYNKNLEPVFEQTSMVYVVSDRLGSPVKVLNIGDSYSDSTSWLAEVVELSDYKITYVGTRGEGVTMHEGRSGFSICDYMTETEYVYGDEGVQPFYNPQKQTFDYAYYLDNTGIRPDVVQIFLGKNGMSLDPKPGIEWLQEMVESIRSVDPTIPIYICETTYMGNQDGLGNEIDNKGRSALNGWFEKQEDEKVFLWTRALAEAFKDESHLQIIPIALCFDSEYNYNYQTNQVNARSSKEETVASEALHPSTEGYLQIADIIFNTYCGTLASMW